MVFMNEEINISISDKVKVFELVNTFVLLEKTHSIHMYMYTYYIKVWGYKKLKVSLPQGANFSFTAVDKQLEIR